MNDTKQLRIAVIKTDGIGDAVLASPFLFELRKNFKKAHITGILSPGGEQVLGDIAVFDEVKVFDPMWLKHKNIFFPIRWFSALKLFSIINSGKFDMIIGLRWQDRLTSLILSLCNVKDKYGYDTGGMGFWINHKIPMAGMTAHNIDRNMNVLEKMLPGKKFSIKLGISSGKEAKEKIKKIIKGAGKYIVIHPVSGRPAKDWSIDKYKELGRRLAKKHKVFIIGAKTDAGIGAITGRNILNNTVGLSIRETGELIRKAFFVIGNDSAFIHVASVFNIRSLALFSGTELYENWIARAKNSYTLIKDVVCRKCELAVCDRQVHECMEFEVDYVEKLANKIIAGRQKRKVITV